MKEINFIETWSFAFTADAEVIMKYEGLIKFPLGSVTFIRRLSVLGLLK